MAGRDPDALGGQVEAIDEHGPDQLSPRECAVLQHLAEGLTAAAIGRRLLISERTVQKHLEHAYRKLGVGDRLCAVLRARDAGVLPDGPPHRSVRVSGRQPRFNSQPTG